MKGSSKTLTILETSDMHGYLFPTNYQRREMDEPFGLLKVAAIIRREREQAVGPVFAVENGDFIQGSPLSYFLAKQRQDPTELMRSLNLLDYDAGVLGNHSFNYGLDYLRASMDACEYPLFSANILTETGEPFTGRNYQIFEKDGIKIGFLGLTTPYIPHWEHPQNYAGLSFQSALECAQEIVPVLRKQADVVVVSYHGGFECDLQTGEPTEAQTGENEGYRLATEVPGIDVLLTGHQHRTLAEKVNGVAVVQPGEKGSYVGKVVLQLTETAGGWQVETAAPELLSVREEAIDPELAALFQPLHQEVEEWLDQPLGKVEGSMAITDAHQARIVEHPYVEFIQRVQMDATGAAISGTALFNNLGKGFGQTIRMRDIVTNYIYPNTLAVLAVKGSDLRAALEQSARYFVVNDEGAITVNPDFISPKPQYYNYDMYEGVTYTIDVSRPIGARITQLSKDGRAIQDDERLEVVTNQYRAVGGGNYPMFSADKIIREVTVDMTELIADYIQEHRVLKATVNHNFRVINGES